MALSPSAEPSFDIRSRGSLGWDMPPGRGDSRDSKYHANAWGDVRGGERSMNMDRQSALAAARNIHTPHGRGNSRNQSRESRSCGRADSRDSWRAGSRQDRGAAAAPQPPAKQPIDELYPEKLENKASPL